MRNRSPVFMQRQASSVQSTVPNPQIGRGKKCLSFPRRYPRISTEARYNGGNHIHLESSSSRGNLFACWSAPKDRFPLEVICHLSFYPSKRSDVDPTNIFSRCNTDKFVVDFFAEGDDNGTLFDVFRGSNVVSLEGDKHVGRKIAFQKFADLDGVDHFFSTNPMAG